MLKFNITEFRQNLKAVLQMVNIQGSAIVAKNGAVQGYILSKAEYEKLKNKKHTKINT